MAYLRQSTLLPVSAHQLFYSKNLLGWLEIQNMAKPKNYFKEIDEV
jgi:hypothetical protein